MVVCSTRSGERFVAGTVWMVVDTIVRNVSYSMAARAMMVMSRAVV